MGGHTVRIWPGSLPWGRDVVMSFIVKNRNAKHDEGVEIQQKTLRLKLYFPFLEPEGLKNVIPLSLVYPLCPSQ